MTIRVLLCDGHPVWRTGLRTVLEADGDIEVVADLNDGLEAVRLAGELRPDVVLVGADVRGIDGLEVTRRLTGTPAGKAIGVILVVAGEADGGIEAVRAGAQGYLLKDLPGAALISAVRAVAAGEAVLAPSAARRLLDHFADCTHRQSEPPFNPQVLHSLTRRERSVLRLVARGLTNAGIASALGLSVPTVKSHVSHILGKLKLQDRAQAVVIAYETGFVQPGHLTAGALAAGAGAWR
jgi:DNA-binding NarL/FixJ family response regulator